jgi:hypothetical protein
MSLKLLSSSFLARSAVSGMALLIGLAAAHAQVAEITKVTSGNNLAVSVDNGFIIFQGSLGAPTLGIFDANDTHDFKVLQHGFGQGSGNSYDAGGITFGPCTPGAGNNCQTTTTNGVAGTGIGFGQIYPTGASGSGPLSVGGWISDDDMSAHVTDGGSASAGGVPGAIAGVSIDPTNGSFAVGWHTDSVSGNIHGLVWPLGANYKPGAEIDLPGLGAGVGGGQTSAAFAASQHSSFVVGAADFSPKIGLTHAVYAALTPTPATSWSDATTGWPTTALGYKIDKSKATAANDTGTIAGQVTATETNVAGHKSIALPVGFVESVSPTLGAPTFFGVPGAEVIPMQVLANGDVVGNLYFIPTVGSGITQGSYHPFVFDGTTLTDLFTQAGAFTGPKSGSFATTPPYSCRVNHANDLGELIGTCIATSSSPYNVTAKAFYINAQPAAGATVEDLNATLHANFDATIFGFKGYNWGLGLAIDDEHEIVFEGVTGSNLANRAAWIAEPAAY